MVFFISPPFGNYINLPHTYRIKGSFTLEPRYGLWGQVFKTVRYSYMYGGWINKIGLRNIGIIEGLKNIEIGKDIMSIAILDKDEIEKIEKIIPDDLDIELNVSCPNIDKQTSTPLNLNKFINPYRNWCIIKLGPLEPMNTVDNYYKQGFRQFHVSNTLKVKNGGLSGPSLRPYTNILIEDIREKYNDNVTIIGGGGVRYIGDATNYISRGADYVSVSTLCFNPVLFSIFYYNMCKNK